MPMSPETRAAAERLLEKAKQELLSRLDYLFADPETAKGAGVLCPEQIAQQATELRQKAEETYLAAVCHECCCCHEH